jgi:methanogenic corrinoid protein MtbC1
MDSFGSRLKHHRKQKRLSQKNLAEAIGVGQTTIANYEKDLRFPSETLLLNLSMILEVSLDELLGQEVKKDKHEDQGDLITPSQLIEAVIHDLDDSKIEEVLRLAQSGLSVFDIYKTYLRPIMYQVGDMWEKGDLSIADEHHISSIVERMIAVVIPYNKAIRTSDYSVLLMTMKTESHRIGLRMINEVFRSQGWRTFYIGAPIPWHSVLTMIKEQGIKTLAISLTMTDELNLLNEFISFIRNFTDVKIIVGGQALTKSKQVSERLDADYYAYTEEDVINIIKVIEEKGL